MHRLAFGGGGGESSARPAPDSTYEIYRSVCVIEDVREELGRPVEMDGQDKLDGPNRPGVLDGPHGLDGPNGPDKLNGSDGLCRLEDLNGQDGLDGLGELDGPDELDGGDGQDKLGGQDAGQAGLTARAGQATRTKVHENELLQLKML